MNNEEYAFKILNLLNTSQNYYTSQEFRTTTPKLEEVEESSILKQFSDVQLLGMYYSIKISSDVEEQFLLYATPLEHLLSTNIILSQKNSVYRIEYDYKICLILPHHIDYLQKQYTFLEEIESHYLENFNYTPSFQHEITLLLPQSRLIQNKIIVVDENSSVLTHYKPLLTPHLHTSHANYCIKNHLFIFDIASSKQFLEYVFKYSYFTYNSTTKHFFGGQIINFITTRYFIEIIPSYANIAINSFATTFYFKVSPNTNIALITTQKSNYPLPIFISSKNMFVDFSSLESFKQRTGVNFKYDYDLLQKLMIKENYSYNAQFCHFFVPKNTAYLLFEKSLTNFYSSPTQYYIKSIFQSFSSSSHNLTFCEENNFGYNYSKIIEKLLEMTKKAIINNAHYPDFSKQSIISHYCIFVYKQINLIKEEFTSLLEILGDNSKSNVDNEGLRLFDSKYYLLHEKLYTCLEKVFRVLRYIKIAKDEIYEINLILSEVFSIVQKEKLVFSKNVECEVFDFSSIDFSFFIDLNLFSTNLQLKDLQLSAEKIFDKYNDEEVDNYYYTVYSISLLFNYLSNTPFKFATNNADIKKMLQNLNSNCEEIDSFNLNYETKKLTKSDLGNLIFSNSLVELYFK